MATCHWRAEPQEGDEIARAWITDLKVYPRYQYTNDVVRPRGDSGGLLKFEVLVDNICQALLVDQMGSFGKMAGFGKFSTKNTTKKVRNHQIDDAR